MNWFKQMKLAEPQAMSSIPTPASSGVSISKQPQVNTQPVIKEKKSSPMLQKAYERYKDILKYSPEHDKNYAIQRASELFQVPTNELIEYVNSLAS